MALVRFGNGVSEIRGSIAGSTFSRSRSGAVIRNRIKPVNPNTQPQADVRYLFAQVARRFAELTAAQRDQWNEYASLLTFWKNRLGESYTPSARQVYQYCITNLVLAKSVLVTGNPPTYQWDFSAAKIVPDFRLTDKPNPPEFQNGNKLFTAGIDEGALVSLESQANLLPPSATEDVQTVIAEATLPDRPTVRNRINMYRYLGGQVANSAAQLNILPSYATLYSSPAGIAIGDQILVRLSTVNKNGLRSDPVEITVETVLA